MSARLTPTLFMVRPDPADVGSRVYPRGGDLCEIVRVVPLWNERKLHCKPYGWHGWTAEGLIFDLYPEDRRAMRDAGYDLSFFADGKEAVVSIQVIEAYGDDGLTTRIGYVVGA